MLAPLPDARLGQIAYLTSSIHVQAFSTLNLAEVHFRKFMSYAESPAVSSTRVSAPAHIRSSASCYQIIEISVIAAEDERTSTGREPLDHNALSPAWPLYATDRRAADPGNGYTLDSRWHMGNSQQPKGGEKSKSKTH